MKTSDSSFAIKVTEENLPQVKYSLQTLKINRNRYIKRTLQMLEPTVLNDRHSKPTNLFRIKMHWWIILAIPMLITPVKSEGTHIWKCCFKGEELHTNGRDCVSRTGKRIDPLSNIHNESTLELSARRPHDLYWLPPELRNRDLSVHFAGTLSCDRFLVLQANDTSRISFGEGMNVTLRVSDSTIRNVETIEPADYCLEATNGPMGPWAIRMCTYGTLPQIFKCCPQSQLIVEEAGTSRCVENFNMTMNGSKDIRNMNTNPLFAYNSYLLCSPGQFRTLDVSNVTRQTRLKFLLGRGSFEDNYLERYPCLDGRMVADGNGDLQWSIGVCGYALPRFEALQGPAYLSVPAAALLAAAVAATLAHAQSRASTHGRALACHAAALLAANACNAAYNFRTELCQPLAIAINFFLLAAAFWLQVICINMARGFSQMLRNKSAVGGKRSGLRAFCIYSLYAWGLPVIATIVIVSTLSDYAFSGPLYHTKTCFFEDGPISRTRKTNTLFYYYAPMCIILLMNIAMFAYTALKIRAMRKDVGILHQKEDGQPSGTRQSAVLYVKLLLLMGVVETAADVAAWATKDSDVVLADGSRLTDQLLVYSEFLRRELTYRCVAYALDFARAASIFAVCCCGRQARARARAAWTRWRPLARWRPSGAQGATGRARGARPKGMAGTSGEENKQEGAASVTVKAPGEGTAEAERVEALATKTSGTTSEASARAASPAMATEDEMTLERTERLERTPASNVLSTRVSSPAHLVSFMRRLPARIVRPFRRRVGVESNDASMNPRLSMETVITSLEEEPQRLNDSQDSS